VAGVTEIAGGSSGVHLCEQNINTNTTHTFTTTHAHITIVSEESTHTTWRTQKLRRRALVVPIVVNLVERGQGIGRGGAARCRSVAVLREEVRLGPLQQHRRHAAFLSAGLAACVYAENSEHFVSSHKPEEMQCFGIWGCTKAKWPRRKESIGIVDVEAKTLGGWSSSTPAAPINLSCGPGAIVIEMMATSHYAAK
jgi:hypothetical protein